MEPTTEMTALSSDLAMYAARLVRLIRQNNPQPAGIRAMSTIDQHGPLGVTTLAQLDNCSQPTMTGIVRQLLEQGWVSREPHPTDARSTLIGLTDEGRAELTRVRAANAELVASRIAHHPQRTAADLAIAVGVLRDVLTEPTTNKENQP
ncbi:MAG TPA: MarR family transcriptional regulator [Nocardioides sp.]|nr:MarR family transcriptional regulator [Nocardioides sp.]